MNTPSASAVPAPHEASPNLDRGTRFVARAGVAGLLLWAGGALVAYVSFPSGADGAAYAVNTIAYIALMVGTMVMALIGPAVTMLALRKLDVRSWSAEGDRALAVLAGIVVSVASVAAVLYLSMQVVESLWERWPQ